MPGLTRHPCCAGDNVAIGAWIAGRARNDGLVVRKAVMPGLTRHPCRAGDIGAYIAGSGPQSTALIRTAPA